MNQNGTLLEFNQNLTRAQSNIITQIRYEHIGFNSYSYRRNFFKVNRPWSPVRISVPDSQTHDNDMLSRVQEKRKGSEKGWRKVIRGYDEHPKRHSKSNKVDLKRIVFKNNLIRSSSWRGNNTKRKGRKRNMMDSTLLITVEVHFL